MGVAQLPQIACDDVHLRAPAEIQRTAWREQLLPLIIGQVALHAIVEGDRLVFGGFYGVPGECDDRAVPVLPLDLFNHGRPRKR